MVYIIHKKTNYQDLGRKRIDVGLNYVEEKYIDTPKEYALFGAECCKGFIEEDVFFYFDMLSKGKVRNKQPPAGTLGPFDH